MLKSKKLLPICSIFLFLVLNVLSYYFLPSSINSNSMGVQINRAYWQVEIVNNDLSRAKGLSGRGSLAPGAGMLFIFNTPSRYTFWMRDMKFPLDMIWINDGKVVDITKNAPPLKLINFKVYSPVEPANMVLEVNAGQADQYGIKSGDQVLIYQGHTVIIN